MTDPPKYEKCEINKDPVKNLKSVYGFKQLLSMYTSWIGPGERPGEDELNQMTHAFRHSKEKDDSHDCDCDLAHYTYPVKPYSARIDFRRQNLTSTDVWSRSPHCKSENIYNFPKPIT